MANREILFHGKRLDNGEWIEGDLHQDKDLETAYISGWNYYTSEEGLQREPFEFEVDPSTVGQYAGVCAALGAQIFEGDICRFTVFDCFDNDTEYTGVVVFSGSRFMLWKSTESEYYGADGGFDLDWVAAQDDDFEVIGSVHDNPELLGGAEHE